MNKDEYIHLLYNPDALHTGQAMALGSMIQQYPYLQSARALYLKALYNAESYRYNNELKKTAAYTTDRSVLFDFITSEQFSKIKQQDVSSYYEDEIVINNNPFSELSGQKTEVIDEEPEINTYTQPEVSAEADVVNTLDSVVIEEDIYKVQAAASEEKLEIGRPLEFIQEEKHSFREWLQLSKLTLVNREAEQEEHLAPEEIIPVQDEPEDIEKEEAKTKKLEIIDRFIEANPKISPVKNAPVTSLNLERSEDTSYLMTETLARVYLEQKKYNKAIQAYEILILKYPEKSIYFADLILDIKNIQQNNN